MCMCLDSSRFRYTYLMWVHKTNLEGRGYPRRTRLQERCMFERGRRLRRRCSKRRWCRRRTRCFHRFRNGPHRRVHRCRKPDLENPNILIRLNNKLPRSVDRQPVKRRSIVHIPGNCIRHFWRRFPRHFFSSR